MPYLLRWKSRADFAQLEQTNDRLRSDLIRLRRELAGRKGYAAKLELVVKQRSDRIDQLTGVIERLRSANQKLDAEAERLAEMVRLVPQGLRPQSY